MSRFRILIPAIPVLIASFLFAPQAFGAGESFAMARQSRAERRAARKARREERRQAREGGGREQKPGAGVKEYKLKHDGRTRWYRLYLPPKASAMDPLPLVIVMHGGGGSSKNAEVMSNMTRKAEEMGFAVVYPSGRPRHYPADDQPSSQGRREGVHPGPYFRWQG